MPDFNLTAAEKVDLGKQQYLIRDNPNTYQHKRCYWDPHLDEAGRPRGWTRPLPGDPLRMNGYLRKGFRLQDPEGNFGPPAPLPRGYKPIVPQPVNAETAEIAREIAPELATQPVNPDSIVCPLCNKEFTGHMKKHEFLKHQMKHMPAKLKKNKKGG